MIRFIFLFSLFVLSLKADEKYSSFKSKVEPLFKQHCHQCHGQEKVKGDLDLTLLKSEHDLLKSNADFIAIKESLLNEDMPPKPKKTGFSLKHRKELLLWIEDYIENNDYSHAVYQDPGPSFVRQLTTDEYNRTIKNLFGIEFNINEVLGVNKEKNIKAFSNLASSLQMSPLLMEKYFSASDLVIAQILKDEKAKAYLFKGYKNTLTYAKRFIARTLMLAYRRLATKEEVNKHVDIYKMLRKKHSGKESLLKTVKPILVSPWFINRIELNQEGKEDGEIYKVSDLDLATRMSFFLWSTTPDFDLILLAAKNKLHNDVEIEKQVERMLKDPKATSLVDNFLAEWLQYPSVAEALPNTTVYPTFNDKLKEDLQKETRLFTEEIFRNDMSVLSFIDSNFTFLNESVANHYGIPGVKGTEFKKVRLEPEYNRGGLLGMASMLAMTSHTNRTKPTARGKWVAEVLLGTKIPEPPDEVEGIDEQTSNQVATTFRQKLEQHVTSASCAVCHNKMDPLGFTLENYNAIGQWRVQEAGMDIDQSGVLPNGQQVRGVNELKKVILSRKDEFVKNLFTKMLSFAIGRDIEYYDEYTILKAVDKIKKDNYKFSSLVLEVVKSRPFLYRKNIEVVPNQKIAQGSKG